MAYSGYSRASGSSRGGSSSRGGYSRGGSSRGGNFRRNSYSTQRSGGGRGRGRGSKPRLDSNLFIQKAKVVIKEEYKSKHQFKDFDLEPEIKANVAAKGYTIPTPIQDQSIPLAIEGKDIIGIASTGTGKTAAFLLPTINKMIADREQKAIVICPTRELAEQVEKEFWDYTKGLRLRTVRCIGGESSYRQVKSLQSGFNLVVGTPGRIKDLFDRGNLRLEKFQTIILDEVDRMVDMGFIDDIRYLLSKLPEERQSLFFSATMDRNIEGLVNSFARDAVKIQVSTTSPSENVEQDIIRVTGRDAKLAKLIELIDKDEFEKILVFVSTKREADRVDRELYEKGYKVDSIHGDKHQRKRQKSVEKFRNGHINILVATDVAARGLDINNITHVINYDAPETFDTYIHRIGRTGRANKAGNALTFVD